MSKYDVFRRFVTEDMIEQLKKCESVILKVFQEESYVYYPDHGFSAILTEDFKPVLVINRNPNSNMPITSNNWYISFEKILDYAISIENEEDAIVFLYVFFRNKDGSCNHTPCSCATGLDERCGARFCKNFERIVFNRDEIQSYSEMLSLERKLEENLSNPSIVLGFSNLQI